MMDFDIAALSAEFPRAAVHWRAQTITKNGDKALALCYLDARDVMDRLDEVCGPGGWQDEYTETASGRVLCSLSIRIGDEWVAKSDGAGGTQVEAEKGGVSDAFKRAAVKWGIGRYLYRVEAVWVPCKTWEGGNGKKNFDSFTVDPWSIVDRKAPPKKPKAAPQPAEVRDRIKAALQQAKDVQGLDRVWRHKATEEAFSGLPEPMQGELTKVYSEQTARVCQAPENGAQYQ